MRFERIVCGLDCTLSQPMYLHSTDVVELTYFDVKLIELVLQLRQLFVRDCRGTFKISHVWKSD